jgi:hypothetical protein
MPEIQFSYAVNSLMASLPLPFWASIWMTVLAATPRTSELPRTYAKYSGRTTYGPALPLVTAA